MRSEKLFWALAVISVIIFWIAWYVIYLAFYGELQHRWSISSMLLFIGSLFYYLFIFICRKTRESIWITGLLTAPAIILGGSYWYNMIATWLLVNALYFLAIKRIKLEQKYRIKINVYRTLRRGVPIIGTALSLLIAAGFYFSVVNKQKIGQLPRFEIEISQKITNSGLRLVNYVMPTKELKWIIEGISVDDYINRTMQSRENDENGQLVEILGPNGKQIQPAAGGVEMAKLDPAVQAELLELNRGALEQQLGMELTGEERIDQLINSMVNKRINEIFNGEMFSASIVPLGAAFGIFVTVRSLIWISNLILYWLTTGMFKVFVWLKLIRVRTETREVELISNSGDDN